MNGYIAINGCMKCGKCNSICEALDRIDGTARINYDKCTACLRCVVICPNKAIKFLE